MERKNLQILLLLLTILVFLCACSRQPPRSENDIIREMVADYGRKQDFEAVESLLRELHEINPDNAALWQNIMYYWQDANRNMPSQYKSLPDGLDGKNLCIIVLGFQLNSDGSMKDELIGRLETALRCAVQYPDALILCTGGGTASENRGATEAGEMAAWLVDQGVASERIVVEDKSLSTVQNAQFSDEILQSSYPEITSVAIVTSDYHIPWGAVLFQTQFLLSDRSLSVVAHAAYPTNFRDYYDIPHWQASGILELAGIR